MCIEPHSDRCRLTVPDACGPVDFNAPIARSALATVSGMPCCGSLSFFAASHRWWAMNFTTSEAGAGQGRGDPVAANAQRSR